MKFDKFKQTMNMITIYIISNISLSILIRIPSNNFFLVLIFSTLVTLIIVKLTLKNIYVKQISINWRLSLIDFLYIFIISIFNFLVIYTFSNIYNSSTSKNIESYYSFTAVLVILGPLVEELVFRGLLCQLFTNKYIYAFISSCLFSLIHSTESIFVYLGLFFSGILLSFSYIKTNNILIPIFVHSINNIIAILLN